MAAPKGNNFWERRSKHGRNKLFANEKLLWKAACEYFHDTVNDPFVQEEKKYKHIEVDGDDDVKMDEVETKRVKTARPFTLMGLCLYLGCNEAYFRQFKLDKVKCTEGFSTVISNIENVIEKQLFEGASVGIYNANLISRKLGLADKMVSENLNYSTDITAEEAKAIRAGLEKNI